MTRSGTIDSCSQHEDLQRLAVSSFCRVCWEASPRLFTKLPTHAPLAVRQDPAKSLDDSGVEQGIAESAERTCPVGHVQTDRPVMAVLWPPLASTTSPLRQTWHSVRAPPV